MEVKIFKTYDALADAVAARIIGVVQKKPNTVLGLATGSTPLGAYKRLIDAHRAGLVSFADVITFNLDEYVGLASDNSQSCQYYMRQNFFSHIDIKKENVFIPHSDLPAGELSKHCEWYEKQIKDHGGIDLQLLGIGHNGHIGFNEPGSSFDSRTRVVNLDKRTIEANARFFNNESEVPKKAITMGLKTISEAREIILVASGAEKASAISATINGKPSPEVPASVLRRHIDVTFYLDTVAASML